MGNFRRIWITGALTLAACTGSDDGSAFDSATASASTTASTSVTTTAGTDTTSSSSDGTDSATAGTDSTSASTTDDSTTDGTGGGTDGPKFDVVDPDAGNATGGGDCVAHSPCDAGTQDLWNAMGLNCPGELQVNGTVDAHSDGLMILESFGQGTTYDPREGSSYVLMSTGILQDRIYTEPDSPSDSLGHCNMWFTPGDGMDTTQFPPPIKKNNVAGDCLADPNLVGTGDCSNSIQAQFNQSGFKYDYQELRFTATVPQDADSLSFNVAYLTTEWPIYSNQPYNDMFIAWVESSNWSGNVSFDANGNALSLNAAFFEYLDQNGDLPQFAGTCLKWHGGTKWLETTVPVPPGEQIEVVFAIFDLDDVNWDSMVLIDNVRWGCGDAPPGPDTKPEG